MNEIDRWRPGSSAFHGAGAEPDCAWRLSRSLLPARPIGVCADPDASKWLAPRVYRAKKVVFFLF
ncbi:hypothetical protein [Domibacillus robiginosus]|uniref:hypothetical protein n=1 Tax=Domibacillus robiginosus TaxID=1071054 RepID=UPI0012E06864|nr:hypothetical protein [Domibacillus robiginosus]